MAIPDKAVTRGEQYLASMAGESVTLPDKPVTRTEKFLAKAAGQDVETPPPITREEKYLDVIAEGGGGGGDITLTTLNVSANGTTNAPSGTAYNKVVASVANSYAAGDEGKVVSNGALVSQTSDTATSNGTVDTTLINSLTVAVPLVHAIIGTSTAASNSMVIPKADGYNNFYAYPKDGDAAYFDVSGRPICCFRLSWMGTSVYSMKAANTNLPPTSATGVVHPTANITETASSISVKFNNVNTMGGLPNGTTIAYILW